MRLSLLHSTLRILEAQREREREREREIEREREPLACFALTQ